MALSPTHGISLPDAASLDQVPADLMLLTRALEPHTPIPFATTAARDQWLTETMGGVEGDYLVIVRSPLTVQVRSGGAWVTIWSAPTKTALPASSNITSHTARIIHNAAERIVHLDGWVKKDTNNGFIAATTTVAVMPTAYAHTSPATFRWEVPGKAADGTITRAHLVLVGNYGDSANQLSIEPDPSAPKPAMTVWLDSVSYSNA